MPGIPHPGVSELGWLADLKDTAEQVGSSVLGERIRWDVEGLAPGTLRRPDVVIRRDSDGSIIATGEAKRPDTPDGVHPLVASEVRDAIEKAQMRGARLCFTTNFFEMAVFDARNRNFPTDLDRLQGNLIPLISPTAAIGPDWWNILPSAQKAELAVIGLRLFFERLRHSFREPVARDINEITLYVFARTTDRLLYPLFESFIALRDAGEISGDVFSHALQAHLNISDDSQARYLVAQGIAEVLTATLFYRNISDYFSLDPVLAGTNPASLALMTERVNKSFNRAENESGDYETIFELSPTASWVLLHGGDPVLQLWKNLFAFVEQIDFTSVSSDIIGTIFERLISPERRHEMGQHYTNARVAQSVSRWAVLKPTDVVADVACGAGTFLVEAWKRLASYGISHTQILAQVLGNDIDPFAVHLAAVNLATREIYRGANYPAVRLGDAFDIRPGEPIISVTPKVGPPVETNWPTNGIDAVVGNPPYAESAADEQSLRGSLNLLGLHVPPGVGGNLAAWFGLLAAALINDSGRWGLVLPTGVLQNGNTSAWREWLRRGFNVVIWHSDDDVWFSDARVATCVVLATASRGPNSLHFVDVRERIQGELVSLDGVPSPTTNVIVRNISHLPLRADIFIAGTMPADLDLFSRSNRVKLLGDIEGVDIFSGNKLGHAMYQLRDLAPTRTSVLRDVEGYEMQVRLNRKYLKPFLRSPMDERTGEFRTSEYWVLSAPQTLPSSGSLRSYIDNCRRLGVQNRPSVRQRGTYWWSVNWRTCQVAVQIHPGFRHQVWWSNEPFVAKNNFHILTFSESIARGDRELIAASLASAFGGLAALYLSSEVGNEGVRWLNTDQFEQWPVLDPVQISREDRDEVLLAYRLFRQLPAQETHEMDSSTAAAWETLTTAVAKAAGLDNPVNIAKDAIEVARQTCVRRAARETLALAGRTRTDVRRGSFTRQIQARLETSSVIPPIIDDLTTGPREIRLRPAEVFIQGTLDFGEDLADIPGEEALSSVLGPGFECAPRASVDEPDRLALDIRAMLDGLIVELIGQPPARTEAAATYREISAEIRRAAIQWLQEQVHDRLH